MGKDDLVGYLGLRGLSIPISLEIDAEVNNESQGCYLLLATCLPIIMPAVVSQETTLHKFKLQSFPPFPPPPSLFLFFSFLFLGGGRGGEVGGGGKGGRSKPPPLSPRKGGVGDEVSPTPLLVLVLKNKKNKSSDAIEAEAKETSPGNIQYI